MINNSIQVFDYNEQHQIRTTVIDGDPWFVGKDVALALGYSNTKQALADHVDAEDKRQGDGVVIRDPIGREQQPTVINESGMYSLIFASKLPSAKQFKHWVTHEVLPSIRKHGVYLSDKAAEILQNDPQAFDKLLQQMLNERDKNRLLQQQIDNDRPFTTVGKIVLALPGCISFKDAADFLAQHGINIGQNRLFKKCRDKKLLCSRKGRQWNKPTKQAIDRGLFNLEINGGFNAVAVVTPRGLSYLTNMCVEENYPLAVLFERAAADEQ